MRIAISGTHVTGKSSLVEALSEALPQYATIDEPYHLLQEEGYEFAELPSVEDFELQLERAIESLDEALPDVIFDRCPADILGYLLSHDDAEAFHLDEWLPRVQTAIKKLDLVVFLPIEEPDRIVLPLSQDAAYRQRVDEKLRDVIVENIFDFEMDVLEVSGNLRTRIGRVLAYINPCELESPGSRRGRNAEFAGGRVLEGSHRLLPVGAPLTWAPDAVAAARSAGGVERSESQGVSSIRSCGLTGA